MSDEAVWKCECGERFTTEPERHEMKWCPGCDDEYVDHEEHYVRATFGLTRVDL